MTTPRARPEGAAPRAAVHDDDADDDLLRSLCAGGVDAVAEAYDRWHQRVRVLARRLLSDDAAAEDVVQEVFVALPKAARRYRGEVPLRSFVLGITVKRSRAHIRSAARRRRLLRTLHGQPPPPGPHDPELLSRQRELAHTLALALDRLPIAQRVAFVLCEVEGLSCAEASPLASAPEATVRTRLFHARQRLRKLLAGAFE